MKRVLTLILALMMVLSLCGCGGAGASAGTDAKTTALGETVSTDILEVTVKKAALAYAAAAASYNASTDKVSNLDEACEPADSGLYQSNKGRCLLCIDFVLKNTDRATIDTDNCYVQFTVKQNGKSADLKDFDFNNPDGRGWSELRFSGMPISVDGGDFVVSHTSNMLIDAGESVEIKYVGVVGFEPDALDDPFEVVVSIPNSSGERETFTYTVN